MAGEVSPISSRKSVPPSASSNRPSRRSAAPVNAPFSWPNSSLSSSVSGSAPQLTAMNALPRREDRSCSAFATSSLPVPDSPWISTVLDTGAICSMRTSTSWIGALSPTMPVRSCSRRRSIRRRATATTSSGSRRLGHHAGHAQLRCLVGVLRVGGLEQRQRRHLAIVGYATSCRAGGS